jgi:hypothetical protein
MGKQSIFLKSMKLFSCFSTAQPRRCRQYAQNNVSKFRKRCHPDHGEAAWRDLRTDLTENANEMRRFLDSLRLLEMTYHRLRLDKSQARRKIAMPQAMWYNAGKQTK